MIYNPKEFIGIDIETSVSKFPWKPNYFVSLISTYEPDGTKTSFVFDHNEQKDLIRAYQVNIPKLQQLINRYKGIVGHNTKFEIIQLKNLGLNLDNHMKFCTMIAKYLLQYHSKLNLKLDDLARAEGLPLKDDRIKIMWNSGIDTNEIPLSLLEPYCEHDAYLAWKLMSIFVPRLLTKGLIRPFHLGMEFMDMLADMERNGILFDLNEATKIITHYQKIIKILESKVRTIAINYMHPEVIDDFNFSSGDELSAFLYGGYIKRKKKVPKIITKNVKVRMPYIFKYKDGKQKIKTRVSDHPDTKCIRFVFGDIYYECKGLGIKPLPKTETAKSTIERPYYKTDKDTLVALKFPDTKDGKIVEKILLKISKINKMLETLDGKSQTAGLINKIGTDGYIHTSFHQTTTNTGRLSSTDPNGQNIPRSGTSPIKRCVKPRYDGIANADLSQIELKTPAQLSQDQVLIHELNSGIDLHDKTRKEILKLKKSKLHRVYAKIFNFRIIFRGSAWGFFRDPKMKSAGLKYQEWKQVVARYWAKYKGLDAWHQEIINHVIKGDGTLQVATGRIYKFDLFNGKYNEHQIVNKPVQGIAGADVLPLAAVLIYKQMKKHKMKSIPILTVHDSIVFDYVKSELKLLIKIIRHTFNNLDKYLSDYYNLKWVVKITGDIEIGDNYGNTKKIR